MLRVTELESRCVLSTSCACPMCAAIPAVPAEPFVSSFVGPMLLDTGVPQMASLPGAKHTIYLDFDGHVTENSWWNSNKGIPSIVTPAFDINSNPATFSVDEQDRIRVIVAAVMEDYAPFNVNVTTIAPPEEDLVRSGTGDEKWGMRVCIGGHYQDWWGIPNAGVAYINSFNYDKSTPAMVFAGTLTHTPKYIWEAVTHEVGHTLGLTHDGSTSPAQAYYEGHGNGPTGWAPVMGAAYYKEVTTWSNGTYAFANNLQDDLAIISGSTNGFGYRDDDYVEPVLFGTSIEGIIERSTDVDVFEFSPSWNGSRPGSRMVPTRIRAVGSPVSPNLDLKLTIRDQFGVVVAVGSPSDRLDVDFVVNLRDGRPYFVHVEGDSTENYPRYASMGSYVVSLLRP